MNVHFERPTLNDECGFRTVMTADDLIRAVGKRSGHHTQWLDTINVHMATGQDYAKAVQRLRPSERDGIAVLQLRSRIGVTATVRFFNPDSTRTPW